MSFASLGSMLVTGGNFMFTACTAGSEGAVPSAVINTFPSRNFNYFFNIGLGGFSFVNGPESIRFHGNIGTSHDKGIRAYFGGSSTATYLKDLIINSSSSGKPLFEPIK
uniref:hypothetical protein n=1 Tax=Flavobacterium sp. TaxID=239 RepID=UPI004047A426